MDFHCGVIFPCMRTHVNYTRVNRIKTMYGRSRVNVRVEPSSTFTFTRGLSYIASISFTRVNVTCVGTEKLRGSGINPEIESNDFLNKWTSILPLKFSHV